MGRRATDPTRSRRHRRRDLSLRGDEAEGARPGGGVGHVHRGSRCDLGRGVCPARRQGSLREGVQGRDQGLHGRRRSVRGAGESRRAHRHRAARARGERAADPPAPRGTRIDPGRGDRMSVITDTKLIAPHGGTIVDRTGEQPDDFDTLEIVTLASRELSDLDMIASGALSPLEGFMGHDDYEAVLDTMRLASGLPWALPVCLAGDAAPQGDRVALGDESGKLFALLEVEETYEYDKQREAQQAFCTTDEAHPGVARLYEQKPLYLAGRVTVFERAEPSFPELALDPADTRAAFAERGWKRVVGVQTRNPIHRAHEYLTKVALETVDGLLIHPL